MAEKQMSAAEKAARQEQADRKAQEANDKAYEASRTTPYKKGGKVKTKRYDDGGEVDPAIEDESDRGSMTPAQQANSSASTPSNFGAAFKAARAAGNDTFTFNGKKYTTEMAGSKPAASKPASTPSKASPDAGYNKNASPSTPSAKASAKDFDPVGDYLKKKLSNDSDYNPRLGKYGTKVESQGRTRTPERSSGRPGSSAMKKGGVAKSSASSRGDGIAARGKTKGRYL